MTDKPTGGPAFPGEHVNQEVLKTLREHRDLFSAQDARSIAGKHAGMTLRDYFAAQAMVMHPGIDLTHHDSQGVEVDFSSAARRCYQYADAMIAERAK
jgi:hypothetical protein